MGRSPLSQSILTNEKGEGGFFFILVAVVCFSIIMIFAKSKRISILKTKDRMHFYTCVKKAGGETKLITKKIGYSNIAITVARTAQIATAAATMGVGGAIYKPIIKGLKIAQQVMYFSFLKKMFTIRFKDCPNTIIGRNSSYQTSVIGMLQRNTAGLVKLKDSKWKRVYFGSKEMIKQQFEQDSSLSVKLEVNSQKVY